MGNRKRHAPAYIDAHNSHWLSGTAIFMEKGLLILMQDSLTCNKIKCSRRAQTLWIESFCPIEGEKCKNVAIGDPCESVENKPAPL